MTDKLNDISIYWINLARSNNRKKLMLKNFETYQNNFRIEAVDGREIDKYLIALPENNKASSYEIACTCSHLKAIYTAYISMEQIAIISEDDLDISQINEWPSNLDLNHIIDLAPLDWEILQLNTSNLQVVEDLYSNYVKNNNIISRWNNFSSTVIYLINRTGMEKIIEKHIKFSNSGLIFDFKFESNLVADYLIYYDLITYTVTKPLFNYYTIDSEIHPEHLTFQNKTRHLIKSLLKK